MAALQHRHQRARGAAAALRRRRLGARALLRAAHRARVRRAADGGGGAHDALADAEHRRGELERRAFGDVECLPQVSLGLAHRHRDESRDGGLRDRAHAPHGDLCRGARNRTRTLRAVAGAVAALYRVAPLPPGDRSAAPRPEAHLGDAGADYGRLGCGATRVVLRSFFCVHTTAGFDGRHELRNQAGELSAADLRRGDCDGNLPVARAAFRAR